MRLLLSALLLSLTACAPSMTAPARAPVGLRAAFSEAGVAWVSGGRACVARAPSFQPSCPALPPAVDVAWHGGQAWAGVPSLAAVVTLDGAPGSLGKRQIAPEVLRTLPTEFIQRHRVLPLEIRAGALRVATAEPGNRQLIEDIR